MSKILGKKINVVKRLGQKVARNAAIFGRKAINTVDRLAPVLEVAANALGQPEIAAGIGTAQNVLHSGDAVVRAGAKALQSNRRDLPNAVAQFGDSVQQAKEKVNPLLRQ